jgi:hypothetical protein
MDQKRNRTADIILGLLVTISLTIASWCVRSQVEQGKVLAGLQECMSAINGRVQELERSGSANFQRHEQKDDERVLNIRGSMTDLVQRVTRHDEAIAKVVEALGEIKVLNTKLDSLKEQIKAKP